MAAASAAVSSFVPPSYPIPPSLPPLPLPPTVSLILDNSSPARIGIISVAILGGGALLFYAWKKGWLGQAVKDAGLLDEKLSEGIMEGAMKAVFGKKYSDVECKPGVIALEVGSGGLLALVSGGVKSAMNDKIKYCHAKISTDMLKAIANHYADPVTNGGTVESDIGSEANIGEDDKKIYSLTSADYVDKESWNLHFSSKEAIKYCLDTFPQYKKLLGNMEAAYEDKGHIDAAIDSLQANIDAGAKAAAASGSTSNPAATVAQPIVDTLTRFKELSKDPMNKCVCHDRGLGKAKHKHCTCKGASPPIEFDMYP